MAITGRLSCKQLHLPRGQNHRAAMGHEPQAQHQPEVTHLCSCICHKGSIRPRGTVALLAALFTSGSLLSRLRA
eukprot:703776-Pelagomonas_calceolata.AAC.1